MKKTLIAGTVSVALAALPIVGVFAEEADDPQPIIDTLTVNVNGTCGFSRADTGDAGGSYSQTMSANALNNDFIGSGAVSKFVSSCNNGTGYVVTLTATPLAHSTGDGEAITYATASGAALPTDPTAGSGTWVANRTATTGTATHADYSAAGNILNNGTAYATTGPDGTTASSFSVKYMVSTHTVQAQGSYSGTATYTLAQNDAS